MKIVFNIAHLATRGGKERVLVNKANYMAREWGAEVVVVTTEQKGRPVVYELDRRVRLVDLEAPYEDFRRSGVIANRLAQSACRRKHRRELTALLERERPDITVAMFGREVTWLPGVKDGSKKVLEYHFYKEVLKRDARRQPLLWLKYWWKMRAVRRYDRFVVLTEEDRRLWGNLKNIAVMPNALTFSPEQQASLTAKRVLAVGRLTEQKGFDYAYTYPGMNKVLQAAGRVIRTADDVGIVALLEERFLEPSYQRLFPREWKSYVTVDMNTVSDEVRTFWTAHGML